MKFKLGIAPIGWTNDDLPELGAYNSFEKCIDEMALAGYAGCEVGNKYPKDPNVLKKALKKRKLQICNAWFSSYLTTKSFEETRKAFINHRDFLYQVGARIIGASEQGHSIQGKMDVPILGNKPVFTKSEWNKLAKGLNKLGKLAQEKGMTLTYHHHMGTGVQTSEEIDRLMDMTDPNLVYLLMDTGHLTFANINPEMILNKYLNRIKHIHLKDVRKEILKKVKKEKMSFLTAVKEGIFTIPGDGMVNFDPLFKTLIKNNYSGWMVVEAEQDPQKANPLKYAKMAKRFIEQKLSDGIAKNNGKPDKVNVGIIGGGRIGRLHAENLVRFFPDVQVSIVSTPHPDKITNWAKQLRIERITENNNDVVDDKDVNTVFICSPTATHARLIKEAAMTGKNIFCEKPISLDPALTWDAVKTAKKYNVKLQVGFNRIFDHNFRELKRQINAGKIGKPQIIHIFSRDPAPPSEKYLSGSGGIFIDMTIHDFHMALHLSEQAVEEVSAAGATNQDLYKKYADVDQAITILKFKNKSLCVIHNSRKAGFYDQRIEVWGSSGTLEVGNDQATTIKVSTEKFVKHEPPLYFFLERYNNSFIDEIRSFINAIKSDKEPLVTGEQALSAELIALAAKQSLQRNTPVKVKRLKS